MRHTLLLRLTKEQYITCWSVLNKTLEDAHWTGSTDGGSELDDLQISLTQLEEKMFLQFGWTPPRTRTV